MTEEAYGILFLIVYMLVLLASLAFGIASYVLGSLGYFTIAKRRGVKNPWLAWIPLGRDWIVGCLSDQYQYVAKGKLTGRRKVLLGVGLASVALAVVFAIVYAVTLMGMVGILTDPRTYHMSEEEVLSTIFAGGTLGILGSLAIAAVACILSVVDMIFYYISLYDVFRSCDPDKAVLFLVLSIILSWLSPFLVFALRKKDDGLPAPEQPQIDPPAYSA